MAIRVIQIRKGEAKRNIRLGDRVRFADGPVLEAIEYTSCHHCCMKPNCGHVTGNLDSLCTQYVSGLVMFKLLEVETIC